MLRCDIRVFTIRSFNYYYSYLVVIVLSIKLWCAIPSTPHPFAIGSNWLNKFIALTIRKLLCFLSEYIHRYTIDKRQWTFFATEISMWIDLDLALLKGYSTQKWKFCHHLLTLKLFQTCMSFFLLLNTKEDILKMIGTLAPLTSIVFFSTMEVNGAKQLFVSLLKITVLYCHLWLWRIVNINGTIAKRTISSTIQRFFGEPKNVFIILGKSGWASTRFSSENVNI